MAYTDNFNLATPPDGNSNSGESVNGNFEIIDSALFNAQNLITKNGDIVTKNGGVLYKSS